MVRPVQEGRDVRTSCFGPIPYRASSGKPPALAAAATCSCGPASDPCRRLICFGGLALWEEKMQEGPENADELKARLARLTSDLRTQREAGRKEVERKAESDLTDKGMGQAMSLGFRVLSEFVAAIVVSTLIGWRLDIWFGTDPLFLILLMGLGVAAGFWSVYRLAVKPPERRGDQKPPQ
jgi:ATP synthase protein I